MEIIGKQVIPVPRDVVWAALNNPEVLKACLPGCESVELTAPNEFKVAIKTVIGPLRARFQGSLRMSEVDAPSSCLMHFEGQGGAVGFGKGSANVALRDTPEGTELAYEARAQVGGKLAQVGSRLIDSVAKKMTDDFFKAFRLQLVPAEAAPDSAKDKAAAPVAASAPAAASTGASHGASHGASASSAPAGAPSPATAHAHPHDTTLVPGWWLAPAALLGAFIAIAAGRWMH
jgi:carbon monoxide dehydrogenase subunit G